MLTLHDLKGLKSKANKTPLDYLLDVCEVASEKYEQEKQFHIKKEETRIPQVVDHQEKPLILDSVIPRRKRSMLNEESMIKKAVENNSENQQQRLIKLSWDVGASSNQEFFRLEKNRSDDRGNRVLKIDSKGSDITRKRLANDTILLGFDNQQQKKKIKRNITVRAEAPAPASVELDIEFKNLITFIGGSLESLKFVIQKTLFKTDVNPAEGRFSIPQKKMSNSFLEPDEDARLNTRNGGKMCEMRVMLIEPSRRVSEINLRKWFMKKDNGKASFNYVLVTYWNEVVRRNDLKVGSKVQLWAFRKGTDLCFALVKLQH